MCVFRRQGRTCGGSAGGGGVGGGCGGGGVTPPPSLAENCKKSVQNSFKIVEKSVP